MGSNQRFFSLDRFEALAFSSRIPILLGLLAFTALMSFFALQLRMDAGFEKQIPTDHEYVATLNQYRDELFGANRLNIVLRAKHGTIWNKTALSRLNEMTQAVMFLP